MDTSFLLIGLLLLSWWVGLCELMFDGVGCGLAASRKAQFFQNVTDVVARGLLRHIQGFRDLFVGIATGDQRQHLALTLGKLFAGSRDGAGGHALFHLLCLLGVK